MSLVKGRCAMAAIHLIFAYLWCFGRVDGSVTGSKPNVERIFGEGDET